MSEDKYETPISDNGETAPRLQFAISLAVRIHGGQFRKHVINGNRVSFLVHPFSVLKRVHRWGAANEIVAPAVVCHDVREDAEPPISFEEVELCIGRESAIIVEELTFIPPKGISHQEKKALKHKYLESFATKSVEALIIKVADRLDNFLDFFVVDEAYAVKYFEMATPLFDAMAARKQEIIDKFGEYTAKAMQHDMLTAIKMVEMTKMVLEKRAQHEQSAKETKH